MQKELSFPTILQNGIAVGYGGNQEWLSSYWKRQAGCGCTCGVNLAAYYASSKPEMRTLYKGDTLKFDQAEYAEAMEEMITYMRPGLMGYPYIEKFAEDFTRFCLERGVPVEAMIKERFNTAGEAFGFVKECIDSEYPIALLILTHRAKRLKDDNWHWLTITGYVEGPGNGGESQIIVSNYGNRGLIHADALFEIHQRNKVRMVSFRTVSNPNP